MSPRPLRLSRPLYEGLPWIYLAGGLAALIGSYLSASRTLSLAFGLVGLLRVPGGHRGAAAQAGLPGIAIAIRESEAPLPKPDEE